MDGGEFEYSRTVIQPSDHEDLLDCKLEAINTVYVEHINKIVIWAHWEKRHGYAHGKAFMFTGTPGGDDFIVKIFNPLGYQVRDMHFYIDDDAEKTGYLIAASNKPGEPANHTIRIFKMNSDYTDIVEVTNELFYGMHREAPNLIKHDGIYYLFTSESAGWYPSDGRYASSKAIDGQFTELRTIGNTSTFSCQSGYIIKIGPEGNMSYVMNAHRWIRGEGTPGQYRLPVLLSDGYAFYDFWIGYYYNPQSGC